MRELQRAPSRAHWSVAALLVLSGLVVFSVYFLGLKGGIPDLGPDAYEYAQAARNIARGEGFRTSSVSVLELSLLGQHGFPLPYLTHDLGNSILLAVAIRAFGASDSTLGWVSGVFFILLPPLVYLLALRFFEGPVPALAAVLVLTNVQLIAYSTTGLSEVPYAFLLAGLFYLLCDPGGAWRAVLIGLVYGALVVLRSNSLPFLPWIVLYLCACLLGKKREEVPHQDPPPRLPRAGVRTVLYLGLFLAGFCLLVVPNAMRNRHWLGKPLYNINSMYASLFHTSAIKGGKAKEIFSQPGVRIDPLQSLVEHRAELPQKVVQQIGQTVTLLLNGGSRVSEGNWADGILVFLFLVSVLIPPLGEKRQQRHFRWLVYAMMLTALLVGALFSLRWRHLYGFIPIVMIYDAELVTRLLGASPYVRGTTALPVSVSRAVWSLGGLAALLVLLGGGQILDRINSDEARERREVCGYYQRLGDFLRGSTPREALVLVKPGPGTARELRLALAWYSRRQTVEFDDYTLQALTAKRSGRPLFLLFASTGGSWEEPVPQEMASLGFSGTKRWELGTARAALLRQE